MKVLLVIAFVFITGCKDKPPTAKECVAKCYQTKIVDEANSLKLTPKEYYLEYESLAEYDYETCCSYCGPQEGGM
jgi:hypothetical protein